MSPVEIHGMALSAPCRLVFMACEALGIEYNIVTVDLFNEGTKTPEYLKVCNFYLTEILCDNNITIIGGPLLSQSLFSYFF